MLHIESLTGRLVFIRAESPITLDEVDIFQSRAQEILCSGAPKIVFADVRLLHVLRAEYADRLAALMMLDAPYLERSAFLLSPASATVELQFDRLLHGNTGSRRLFREPYAAATWLAPVLTRPERSALLKCMSYEPDQQRPGDTETRGQRNHPM